MQINEVQVTESASPSWTCNLWNLHQENSTLLCVQPAIPPSCVPLAPPCVLNNVTSKTLFQPLVPESSSQLHLEQQHVRSRDDNLAKHTVVTSRDQCDAPFDPDERNPGFFRTGTLPICREGSTVTIKSIATMEQHKNDVATYYMHAPR